MPARNVDLHGMAPHQCSVALLLIDVINDLEWPDGALMEPHARKMATALNALRRRARDAGIPIVYVNDNFGQWRSDFTSTVDHVRKEDVRGKFLVDMLSPEEDDYFVLKPKHSGFYGTTLEILLSYLGVHTVILTGIAGNICVLFTANDAYMRDLTVIVPSDCVASNQTHLNEEALNVMSSVLKARILLSSSLDLRALAGDCRIPGEEEAAGPPDSS